MRKSAKSIALPFPGEAIALGVLLFVVSLFAASQAVGADEPESCRRIKSLEDHKIEEQRKLADFKTKAAENPAFQSQVTAKEEYIVDVDARIIELQGDCESDQAKAQSENDKCLADAQNNPGLYEVVDGVCEMKEVGSKSNPNTGECSAAEILRGTNLKGEACQNAAQTIKNVQAQQESIGMATTAAVQGYSSYQATMATGQQADAHLQQKKILQGAGTAKIATGLLQIAGAAQLKSAAGKAETASSDISGAHQGLDAHCNSPAVRRENLSSEQCFYKYAHEFQIIGNAKELATFERLQVAQIQSKAQADRANEMAKASMISGMADTLVGIQAMMMARQQQQQAAQMGAPPPPPIPGYNIGGASQGGFAPGGGATPGNSDSPTDFGNGGGDGNILGGMGGGVGNGIKGGKGFAPTPGSKAAVSTVSTSSGGGGGGGGGSGASRGGGGRRGSGPSNTTTGEYNLAGGGGGFRGGSGPAEKGEGGNAFAEALAKLFPQDPTGKPVVETRQLASEGGNMMEGVYVGSEVEAVEVSLFEQITAKYRQLAGAGSI